MTSPRLCANPECRADISHMRKGAETCSDRCRKAKQRKCDIGNSVTVSGVSKDCPAPGVQVTIRDDAQCATASGDSAEVKLLKREIRNLKAKLDRRDADNQAYRERLAQANATASSLKRELDRLTEPLDYIELFEAAEAANSAARRKKRTADDQALINAMQRRIERDREQHERDQAEITRAHRETAAAEKRNHAQRGGQPARDREERRWAAMASPVTVTTIPAHMRRMQQTAAVKAARRQATAGPAVDETHPDMAVLLAGEEGV